MSQYANLQALQTLPASAVTATAATSRRAGPDGHDLASRVTITNTSSATVSFLLRADVRRGTTTAHILPGDSELQSSIWQDNDITLFPGESQTLTVTYNSADLNGATPLVSVFGSNVARFDVIIGGKSGKNTPTRSGAQTANAVEPARRPSRR
jgi:exo-1,4-beta-D-glucosaminidase